MSSTFGVLLVFATFLNIGWASIEINGTWQVSAFEFQWGPRALDGDPQTCARTGYTEGPWWMVDLYENRTISAVSILGEAPGQFEVRVGDFKGFPPMKENGFQGNWLCDYRPELRYHTPETVYCRIPRAGRYLSVMINDNYQYLQLAICEITVHYEDDTFTA